MSVINSLLFFLYLYIDSGIQDLEDGFILLIISILVSMMVVPIFAFEAFKGRELREKLQSRKKWIIWWCSFICCIIFCKNAYQLISKNWQKSRRNKGKDTLIVDLNLSNSTNWIEKDKPTEFYWWVCLRSEHTVY